VPTGLRELLATQPELRIDDLVGGEPGWTKAAGTASAVGVTVVALATFVAAAGHVERPLLLGALLAAAVLPFVLQCFMELSAGTLAVCVVVPLALQHLGGSALGVLDPQGHEQTSLLILCWLVGEVASTGRRVDVVFVTVAALVISIGRAFTDDSYGSAFVWAVGMGIGLLAGLFIRTLVIALLQTKVADSALQEQAATAERQRIAREVHDVIAHSMTVTMLHVTAARLAVGRGDSAAATEALEEAERAGRTSLNEIRHTVGLLRTDGASRDTAPQPGATDLHGLVDGYRAAGLDVALEVEGALTSIEPAQGLALYRIIQESLTNAGKHAAGGTTVVHVEVGPPLRVDVATHGGVGTRAGGDGMGIAGMAERVAALAGTFTAGPCRDGWRVEATIP
jgi:signal transduction histidine kinase